MRVQAVALLFLGLTTIGCDAVLSAKLRKAAHSRAEKFGTFSGETKAASQFFSSWVNALPANITKAKEDAVVSSLQAEVEKLGTNVKGMKALVKKDRSHEAEHDKFKSQLKGKDKEMMSNMDEMFSRMNRKTDASAVDVMSKLKNAIHLIKKGALSGDKKEADKLNDVLKGMGAMVR